MGRRGPPPGSPPPHPNGRGKGRPNRATVELLDTLNEMGYNPAVEFIEIIRDAREEYRRSKIIHDKIVENRIDNDVKGYYADTGPQYLAIAARAASDLMKYVYPARKAVDITSNGENLSKGLAELVANILITPQDAPKQIE